MFNSKENTTPSVYFKSLKIENVRCFKEKQTIDFTDKNGDIAQWTVILGNNNTGKTTILRCLADMEVIEGKLNKRDYYRSMKVDWLNSIYPKLNHRFSLKLTIRIRRKSKKKKPPRDGFLSIIGLNKMIEYKYPKGLSKLIRYSNIIKYGVLKITDDNSSFINKAGFIENEKLINPENWLLETFLASKNGARKAIQRLKKIKEVLVNILPDVQDFKFVTNEETFKSHVEIKTDFGWTRINDLGYGYQTLMAWVVDLAKRMFDRYPNSETPLKEPAIVLVDEIDLHLHPEWQRKIIHWLSNHFPNTQFIVTAHSPLVIQSAENVNVVLLKKEEEKGEVKIEQPDVSNFQGWTVEEILSELMGLDNRIHSDAYLKSMRKFDEALDEDNYEKAKSAYDELDKMLHPRSPQRKLLRLQMTSLTPLEPVIH